MRTNHKNRKEKKLTEVASTDGELEEGGGNVGHQRDGNHWNQHRTRRAHVWGEERLDDLSVIRTRI